MMKIKTFYLESFVTQKRPGSSELTWPKYFSKTLQISEPKI